MRVNWNIYFMLIAKVTALRSTCNSRPTGAIIVNKNRIITTGYNGSLPGRDQCSDLGSNYCYRRKTKGKEKDKYQKCPAIHAEENAILQAAKMGIKIENSIVYCTLSPCLICAKSLVGAGVVKVYYEEEYKSTNPERDKEWMDFNKKELSAEQIIIPDYLNKLLSEYFINPTSTRRLVEK